MFKVYDTLTGNYLPRAYSQRNACARACDRLDNAYGAYRYQVRAA